MSDTEPGLRPSCTVLDCTTSVYGKGLCRKHYALNRRRGTPTPAAKVKVPKPPCAVDGCINTSYAKGICQSHYQKVLRFGTPTPTPEMKSKPGPAPDPTKYRSRHNPDNPSRSRPKKVRPVRTQCKRGHPFVGDNVYVSKAGVRACRECLRQNTARWREINPTEKVGHSNLRKSHCPHGHPYDDVNTYHYNGGRQCKACTRANGKKHQDNIGRFQRYGITKAEYEEMLVAQNNECAICRKPLHGHKNAHIDHDHVSGNVRGVLCMSCNLSLGKFDDSPEILIAAAKYLMDSWRVSPDTSASA